ncbi:hypothetical protein JOD57_000044 [Geodermatophilus bullaregiensis]|uniref:AAA family ATPase n=1 Tax=Geodermatophilus bullaregiensis TaxID=1564160 RepID=UPI00195F22E1|nr:AAA family ATPase [Geodermatophilus bullaregiensis]MBM7804207.1 hypothetical protein [Geodermatophilus bullaregiensis]
MSQEDWKQALHHLGQDGRRALGSILKTTVSGRAKEIGLLQFKAAALGDTGKHKVARVLSEPAHQVAVELLGDSVDDPDVLDFRRIWDEWASRCTPALARLCLLVTEDLDEPAAASARAFLTALAGESAATVPRDPDGEEQAEPAPQPRERIVLEPQEVVRTLQALADALAEAQLAVGDDARQILESVHSDALVPEQLVDSLGAAATRARQAVTEAAGLLAASQLDVQLVEPLTPSFGEAVRSATEAAEARERQLEADRRRAALVSRRDRVAAAARPLRSVEGPAEYSEAVEGLRRAATPPEDEEQLLAWLEAAPVLQMLVEHLRGERTLDAGSYEALSDLTSPLVLGLALAGKLRLEAMPRSADEAPPEGWPSTSDAVETTTSAIDAPTRDGDEGRSMEQTVEPMVEATPPAELVDTTGDPVGQQEIDALPSPSLQVAEPAALDVGAADRDTASPPSSTAARGHQCSASEGTQSRTEDQGQSQSDGDAAWRDHHLPPTSTYPVSESPSTQGSSVRDTEAPPSTAAIWAGLHRLIGDGHMGAAAWAARGHEAAWGASLEVLALAAALRSDAGPLSAALWTRTQAWVDLPTGSAAKALAAGLCLAAPIAPFAGAADVLELLGPQLPKESSLRELSTAVVAAARKGLVLGLAPAVHPGAADAADADGQVMDARSAAEAQLDTAPARTLKFHRATRVYQDWMAEGGLLGKLLVAVRDDQRAQMDGVRRAALALQDDRTLERAIDETDGRLRGPQATTRIVADPRLKLIELAREALAVVDVWCRAVAALRSSDSQRRPDSIAVEIRRSATSVLEEFRGEDSVGNAGTEETVAHRAVVLGTELLVRRLDEGVPGAEERSPEQVLDEWLPYVFEVSLDRTSWSAVPEAAVPGLLAAPYRTALTAYEGFAARMDHAGSRRLLDALHDESPELLTRLAERRELDLRAAHAAIGRRLHRLRSTFAELEAYPGAIEEGQAVVLRGLLLDAEHPVDDDLLKASTRLDESEVVLDRAREHVTADLLNELGSAELDEDNERAVLDLLAHGALAAAHERLDASRGRVLRSAGPMEGYQRLQRELWSSGIEAATRADTFDRAIAALTEGRSLEPFGPGPAEAAMRRGHAEALDAWRALFRDKRAGDFDGRLRAVLALLALQGPTPRSDPGARPQGTDLAVDVLEARPVLPVVMHELGSGAAGRYRVHVVWGEMSADRLVSLALSDRKASPHLVLYRGVLTRNQRHALAVAARDEGASSRRILVVDEAVVLTMAFYPAPTFALLEHLVLPFARVSAFTPDVAGNVPPELFRGRRRELEAVLDPRGSSFVYGGRQVGKSALLRAAAREVEGARDRDRRAVYMDVRSLGLGLWRDPDEFWLDLLEELQRVGVVTERSSKTARGEAAVSHIRNWLQAVEGRTLLVLLDECDDLLDADARKDFPIVERLRGLMNVTDRRFKVVLAGLHQVQRFERQRNVPLAHFAQQPVNVGPLDPADAVELLGVPLSALGYTLSDAATWHLLSETNYQAGMVQVFGQALLRDLLSTPRRGGVIPTVIERSDVERVYKDADLGEQMRRRFMLTINLDDRYRCIAFVLALRNLQQGMNADYEEGELRDACAYWWPEGFSSMRPALFAGLVEEMLGLGVVIQVEGRLRIRNPNVVRLLGSRPHIEAELLDFEGHQPSPGFQASLYRRPLPDGGRSPLSEEELAALVEVDAPGLTLVGGSTALGIEQVAAAVAAKIGARRSEITFAADVPPDELAARLAAAEDRVVLAADCRGLSLEEAAKVAQETQAVVDKMSSRTAMRRAIMVLGPGQLALWADFAPSRPGLERTTRLGLRRLDRGALEAWVGEERLDLDRASCTVLLNATGGWPAVLNRVLRKAPRIPWAVAASGARDEILAAGRFPEDALGGPSSVQEVVRALLEIGEPVTWELLSDLVGDAASEDTREALAALQLTTAREDQRFELEPFLAAALRNRSR